MLDKLNEAAARKGADTVRNGKMGGSFFQRMLGKAKKAGHMNKMSLSKNSYVPNELTSVPDGWRLGKLDEVKDSQDEYFDKAKEYFKNDAARVEKASSKQGENRAAFMGNSVNPENLDRDFLAKMRSVAGKWASHFFSKGTVARVNLDSKGKPRATHDKIDNTKVFGVPRPFGARRP